MSLRTRLLPSATPGLALPADWPEGVSASGVVGTITIDTFGRIVSLRTRLLPSATPGFTWPPGNAPLLRSVSVAGQIGGLYVTVTGTADLSGEAGTGAAGDVTVSAVMDADVAVDGISAAAVLGTIAVTGVGTVTLTGLQSAGESGEPTVGTGGVMGGCGSAAEVGVVLVAGVANVTASSCSANGRAGRFDFVSRQLVRAIRITAYLDAEV